MEQVEAAKGGCKTRLSLLWMNLSGEPLIALYSLMPFLLRKELGATPFQLSLFTMLAPSLAVLSFYWGAWLSRKKNHLLANLVGGWVLARLPFLFFPYIETFWEMFFCASIYQLFSRATTPALMEIVKRNLPKKTRESVFSLYYILSVLEGMAIGLFLTGIVEIGDANWRYVFLVSALLSLTSVFFQLQMRVPREGEEVAVRGGHPLVAPIRESIDLLRSNRGFARFQWGFMIGGFALMLIAPVKSIFMADSLSLSIADVTTARCVFVGLGMAGSSWAWRRGLESMGILPLTSWILVGFGLYPLLLLCSSLHSSWFYLAHLVYGIAQGGSHLVWHLSGTIFSLEKNSTPFTTVNVLMVGLRGAVGPLLGAILCYAVGATAVLSIGAMVGLLGGVAMFRWNRESLSRDPEKSSAPL